MSITRLALVLAAPLAALILASPASALDVVRTDYRVVIEGELDYNRADAYPTDDGDLTFQDDEELAFRTEIAKVSFFGEAGGDGAGTGGSATARRGLVTVSHPIGGTHRCATFGVSAFRPGRLQANWTGSSTTFTARVLESVKANVGGCDGAPPFDKVFDARGKALGKGPFDAAFAMPASAIGRAQVVVPLKGGATGQACHAFNPATTLCSLTWEANATFTKTGSETVSDDDLEVPLVPPAPTPAPAPSDQDDLIVPLVPPASDADSDELIVPLVEQARIAANGSAVSVPLSCAAGCSGTATVSLPGRARGAAAKRGRTRALATRRFSFGPAKRATVKVAIPRRSRAAVRRARALRVTLKARPRGGELVTRTVTVKRSRRRG